PLILYEHVPGVSTEVIMVRSELRRCLLRQAEQEIGKIEAAIARRYQALRRTDQLRCVEAAEGKCAARIAIGPDVEFNGAKVSAPAQSMFAVGPNHEIGKRIRLVLLLRGRHILNTVEVRKRDAGYSPIERILGDPANPQVPGDVLVKGIEVVG